MTITREINGEQVEIELTWKEMEEVQKEIRLERIIWKVEEIAEDNSMELNAEQVNMIARDALEKEMEYEDYYPMPLCRESTEGYIQESIEEIIEEAKV